MCDVGSLREFRVECGRLTQCDGCKMMGVEIGTAFFTVRPEEISGLIDWFLGDVLAASEASSRPHKRIYLQIERSRIMLALSSRELSDLWEILQEASRWSDSPIPTAFVEPPISNWVH